MGNPLVPKDGVWSISAHRLNLFQSCPRQLCYYLCHEDEGEVDTKYIDAGQAVHEWMEMHFRGDDVGINDMIAKHGVIDEMVPRVMQCVENAEPYRKLIGEPELSEEKVFVTPKGRTVKLIYRIDLQCEDADVPGASPKLVIDWKTGKSVNKPEYLLQMQVYRFARDFQYDAMLVSLYSGDTLIVNKSAKSYIPNMCDKYIDCIEGLDFERHPNYTCDRFCPYYDRFCSKDHMYDLVVPRLTWDDEQKRWTEGEDSDEC